MSKQNTVWLVKLITKTEHYDYFDYNTNVITLVSSYEIAVKITQNYVNKSHNLINKGIVINPILSEPEQYQWEVLKEQPIISKAIQIENFEDKEYCFIFEEIVIDLLNNDLISY